MKKLKQLSAFGASLFLSMSSLLVFAPSLVHGATDVCTWTGGVDLTFNDPGNWTCSVDGAAVPENGDTLEFDVTALSSNTTLDNDMSNLSVAGINIVGTSPSFYAYTIDGLDITLTGSINNTSNSFGHMGAGIVLGANASVQGQNTLYANTIDVATFSLTVDSSIVLASTLSGSGTITVNEDAAMTIQNQSANPFTGSMDIEGSLLLDSAASITNTAGITVADGACFLANFTGLTGPVTSATPITLEGVGQVSEAAFVVLYGANTGTVTFSALTFDADTDFNSIGAADDATVITATANGHNMTRRAGSQGSLTVNGQAVDSAYASVTYVSPTNDNAGAPGNIVLGDKEERVYNNSTTDNITANAGSRVMGEGTIGNLTLNDGSVVAPGNSPGCLTVSDLTFVSGSTYDFEIGGEDACVNNDQIIATGDVVLGNGTLNPILLNSYDPADALEFIIIDNQGSNPVGGTFNGLAEGDTVTISTVDGDIEFTISYEGGDGNDVVLTRINGPVESTGGIDDEEEEAAAAAETPKTPNTGFAMLTNNPIVTFMTTTTLAGAILALARRYGAMTR